MNTSQQRTGIGLAGGHDTPWRDGKEGVDGWRRLGESLLCADFFSCGEAAALERRATLVGLALRIGQWSAMARVGRLLEARDVVLRDRVRAVRVGG